MAQKHLDTVLATGLRNIYQNNWLDFCDLAINCADGETESAPKLILAIHSEYFAALFRHEPEKTTVTLPQFDSGLVKLVIKCLIDLDENDLCDIELDQVIRVADYFQMTDLVTLFSELIEASIAREKLQEILYLTQEIPLPKLEKACMQFIRDDIIDIFESKPTLFQTLPKEVLMKIFTQPWSPIHDKFGRECDEIETTENLFHILIQTLKNSNRLEDLPVFIENCVNKEYLYTIFAQINFKLGCKSHGRIMPRRLEIEDGLKKLVLSICPKPEIFSLSRAISSWEGGPYGTHNDVRLTTMPTLTRLTQRNHQNWQIEGLIRKINVKSRTWDGRHIIQGIQVFLENGETQAFGMKLDDKVRVDTLEVPSNQHIKLFHIRSGFYIDAIGFETNKGLKFGPIGGTGGSMKPIPSSVNIQPYIDGIRGITVTTQGKPCICGIQFKYVIPRES